MMPLIKLMKGESAGIRAAEGLLDHDWDAVSPCQRECTTRFGMSIQMEQESYLSSHPEIKALLELFIKKMVQSKKRKDFPLEAAQFFTRPCDELDSEIRDRLGVNSDETYLRCDKPTPYKTDDYNLERDLKDIIFKHYPPAPWKIPDSISSTLNTESSSFLSQITSDTTLPTPEPVKTPEPTFSQIMFNAVSNAVDKAIFLHVDDAALRYDTAYVELSNAVEEAMEIPVIEIRQDIAEMFANAFIDFEIIIKDKERIAAEIAWEKRMRKKLKRLMRRMKNFKGYETPPTPKSQISTHESYKKPPPKPCECHPPFHFNRYAKDRYGIYLPTGHDQHLGNMTVTPAISVNELTIENAVGGEDKTDAKSILSKKSLKSIASKNIRINYD